MNVLSSKEKFEDTKVVIISRKLKEDRQWLKAKGQKDKRTMIYRKQKIEQHEIHKNVGGVFGG